MPVLSSYLIRRGDVFYWRRRLPRPLDALLGRSHYTISLGTSDRRFAARLSRALLDAFDCIQDEFAHMPPTSITRELAEQAIKQTTAEVVGAIRKGTYRWGIANGKDPEKAEWLSAILPTLHASLNANHPEMVTAELGQILSSYGAKIPTNSPEFLVLARLVISRVLRALPDQIALDTSTFNKLTGGTVEFDKYPEQQLLDEVFGRHGGVQTQPNATEIRQSHMKLSEAAEKYITTKEKQGAISGTIADFRRTLGVFVQLIGDPLLHQVNKAMAKKFKEALGDLPARNGRDCYLTKPDSRKAAGRRIGFPLPTQKQIDLCEDISEAIASGQKSFRLDDGRTLTYEQMKRATEMLTPKSVNKYLTFFTGFWKSDFVPEHLRQAAPFSGILFPKSVTGGTTGKIRREPFSPEELEELFSTPVWTGNDNVRFRTQAGQKIYWDAKYWVPLIALYTGMRREEVCQLTLKNIDEVDGIKFFVLKKSNMRLKTRSAERDVPIHSELIRLGFLHYVDNVRKTRNSRLFPDLTLSKSHGSYGSSVGKWFYNYRNELGIYMPGKDLHSLRTTFITRLRRKGVDKDIVSLIVGHALQTVTSTNYTHFSIRDMSEAMEKFDVRISSLASQRGKEIVGLDSPDHPSRLDTGDTI